MKLSQILEGIKNTGKIFDILSGYQPIAREIRQTYNKCIKGKIKNPYAKNATIWWSQELLRNNYIQTNPQLVNMLNEIIKLCS